MIVARRRRIALGVLALGAAAAIYWSPVLIDIDGRVAGGNGDPLLVAYLVTWVAEQFGTLSVWNPPFYHPAPNVLAYTDHMIGLALVAWPAVKAGVSPIVVINAIGFLAFLSTAIALFFWLLDDREPVAPALAAALTVTFGAWRAQQLAHPQLLFMPFLPLALCWYGRALAGRDRHGGLRPGRSGSPHKLVWAGAAALILQTLLTASLSVFMLPLVGTWIIATAVMARRWQGGIWIRIAGSLAVVALANLPFAVHYWAEGSAHERTAVEISRFSVGWVDWISAGASHWLYGDVLTWTRGWERELFPGIGFLAILGLGLAGGLCPRGALHRPALPALSERSDARAASEASGSEAGKRVEGWLWPGIVTGLIALWASTGLSPSGGITIQHLPYDLVHAFAPGGRSVRAPARFVIVAGFFFAPVIAAGWARAIDGIRRRVSGRFAPALVSAALVVLVVAEGLPGLAYYEPASNLDARAIREELASGGVVFLPMNHPDGPRRDIERMWAARRSGLPLVNGYSCHSSRMFDTLVHLERVSTDAETRRALYSQLIDADVDTILVDAPGTVSPLIDQGLLQPVAEGVYRIPAGVRSPSVQTAQLGSGIGLLMTEAGWSYPEGDGNASWTWSLTRRATLRVPMDGTPRREIVLRARAVHPEDAQMLELWWNGRSLGAQLLAGEAKPLTYALPAAATRPGWVRFEIRGPEPVGVRGSPDPRRLSVCVYEITVQ